MSEADTRSSSRRRRRRRSHSVGKTEAQQARRRTLFWLIAGLTLLAAGYTAQHMRVSSLMAGGLMPGMTPQELRYLRGAPDQVLGSDGAWLFHDGEVSHTVVRFGADQRVRSISCFGVIGQPIGCADVMGLSLGASQSQLVNRLGPPSSEVFVHDSKVLAYGDMGLAFTLREGQVTAITKVQRSSSLSFLGRTLWSMLP